MSPITNMLESARDMLSLIKIFISSFLTTFGCWVPIIYYLADDNQELLKQVNWILESSSWLTKRRIMKSSR